VQQPQPGPADQQPEAHAGVLAVVQQHAFGWATLLVEAGEPGLAAPGVDHGDRPAAVTGQPAPPRPALQLEEKRAPELDLTA